MRITLFMTILIFLIQDISFSNCISIENAIDEMNIPVLNEIINKEKEKISYENAELVDRKFTSCFFLKNQNFCENERIKLIIADYIIHAYVFTEKNIDINPYKNYLIEYIKYKKKYYNSAISSLSILDDKDCLSIISENLKSNDFYTFKTTVYSLITMKKSGGDDVLRIFFKENNDNKKKDIIMDAFNMLEMHIDKKL